MKGILRFVTRRICAVGSGGESRAAPWRARWWLAAGPVALLLGVAGVALTAWPARPAPRAAGGVPPPEAVPETESAWAMEYLFKEPQWAVGDPAPDFTLPSIASGRPTHLRDLVGHKPVVLVFGSFSCGIFAGYRPALARLYQAHCAEAEFLFVNVREAGHRLPGLEFLAQEEHSASCPAGAAPCGSCEQHGRAVQKALARTGFPLPAVVDGEDEWVTCLYGAFPMRLVVVDAGGRVALDLGRGTLERWDLGQVENWLQAHHG
jgi:hypothetical protein